MTDPISSLPPALEFRISDQERHIREALEAGPTEGPFITFNDQVYRASDPDLLSPVASWNTSQFTQEGVSIDALYYASCSPAAMRAVLAELDAARRLLLSIRQQDYLCETSRHRIDATLKLAPRKT